MNQNAFKTFMVNKVWNLEEIFDYADVAKEYGNHKHIIKIELSKDKEFVISKFTVLIFEILKSKGLMNYEYIKSNYETLLQVTRYTVQQYEFTNSLDTLTEYIGGAVNISVRTKGYMAEYQKESKEIEKGINETYHLLAKELETKSGIDIIQCNKIMYFTWLIFNCNILEIGINGMKLVLKESNN